MKPKRKQTKIRKRKERTLFKGSVKHILENYFHQQPKPSLKEITWLASAVRMDKEVVKVWFSNRRNKEKYKRPPPKTPGRRTRSASRIPASEEQVMDLDNPVINLADEHIESNDATSYGLPRLVSVTSLAGNDMDSGSTSDSNDMPQIIPTSPANSPSSFDIIPTTSKASGRLFKNANNVPGPLSHCSSAENGKIRVPEAIREKSTRIGNYNGIDLYAIPFKILSDPFSTFERYVYGKPEGLPEHRTILMFGTDRSSQMKFIDEMMNYIFNIEQEDKFRFQLAEQETNQMNAIKRVHGIKVYIVHHAKGFRIPFSITIVSMPTYNANESELFNDQQRAKAFLEFLKNKDGIQGLDMICNVVNEVGVNQQSFLTIFGNDVNGTVCSWQPSNYMVGTCTRQENMQHLFASLAQKRTRSLVMTTQVLEERKQMEAAVKGLQQLLQIGNCKIDEMDKAKQMIVFCRMQIESKDEENVESTRKVELPAGQYVNNCNYCHVTCHDSFVEPLVLKYENEGDCSSSSDYFEETTTGFCSFCPEKCNLNMHSNQSYRWVPAQEEKASGFNPADRRRETEIKWNDMKSKGRELVKQLQKELDENGLTMLEHFQATWRCIQRINEIALRRNSFLTQGVFDCLFEAEQQLKQLGFDEGLTSLRH